MRHLIAAAAAAVLLVAGCSSSGGGSTPAAPTSTASYVDDVQANVPGVGNPAHLLRLGHTICGYFRSGGSFTGILTAMSRPQGALSADDADTIILDAVEFLCPAQTDALGR